MGKTFDSIVRRILAISSITILSLLTTPARTQSRTGICQVYDPNDTYVNLRNPPNGTITRSLNNGSEIIIDRSGTAYDSQGRPWTKVVQINRNVDYVISKFVTNCSQ